MRAFLHGDKWWTWNETWDKTAAAAVRRPDVSPEDAATPARDIGLMEELERLRRENTALKEEARHWHSAALKTKTLLRASSTSGCGAKGLVGGGWPAFKCT